VHLTVVGELCDLSTGLTAVGCFVIGISCFLALVMAVSWASVCCYYTLRTFSNILFFFVLVTNKFTILLDWKCVTDVKSNS